MNRHIDRHPNSIKTTDRHHLAVRISGFLRIAVSTKTFPAAPTENNQSLEPRIFGEEEKIILASKNLF